MIGNYQLSTILGSIVVLSIASPLWAAPVEIQSIQIQPTDDGFELTLKTPAISQRPQVFMATRENVWVADLVNVKLNLPEDAAFEQSHPVAGIASVTVNQFEPNSVRITVIATAATVSGELLSSDLSDITFGIYTITGSSSPGSSVQNSSQDSPSLPRSNEATDAPNVLFPNPDIFFSQDSSISQSVPPPLPRAIAPPVGDIAISATDGSATAIDLGTSEVVPRLVLRNAPVREVLALLARAADLNLAFNDAMPIESGLTNANQASSSSGRGIADNEINEITVSLDIEDEPIQDVFNYVLQLVGLEANRKGRTIFVATRLPNPSRNLVIRSLRVNQTQVGVALNFLVAMGAESAVSRERLVTSVNAVPIRTIADQEDADSPIPPAITETQTTTEQRLETQRVDYQDSAPPLRGLLVFGDERTNTITLAGSPQQVEIATDQLVQLDVRRRQVAVNVRVIDINLSALENFSSSFSFGINDVFIQSDQSALTVNINDFDGGGSDGNSNNAFATQLQAQITTGNAKILTDPTLIVQEGQTATVALTEEVQTTTGVTTFSETGDVISFEQDDPRAAGLTLAIEIDRIDDNGFVSLSVAPTITAPAGQQENPDGSQTTLLSSRSLQSGQVRLRDGQTLVLSGIIQDADRSSVTKVPILGDIPILGALFRSTERENDRREVVVLLTPEVLDDSDGATFGYRYTSDRDVQEMLNRSR